MTNITTNPISRRTLLRYGSSAIALPFLGSVLPARATFAAETTSAPKRLLWMTMGHGHMEDHFYPTEAGRLSEMALPPGWDPLKKNLDHFSMISNFSNLENKQPHDGSEAVLTCANVVGFPGRARHNSISCDQIAAAHLGADTRYESLQLNCIREDAGNGQGEWRFLIEKTEARCQATIHR